MSTKERARVCVISKRGNSLMVTIPRQICKRLAWNAGDTATYDVVDGCLVIRKVTLPTIPELRLRAHADVHAAE